MRTLPLADEVACCHGTRRSRVRLGQHHPYGRTTRSLLRLPAALAAYITFSAANGARCGRIVTLGNLSTVALVPTCCYPLFAATATSPTLASCR
jgi:hypothetical protein